MRGRASMRGVLTMIFVPLEDTTHTLDEIVVSMRGGSS
jgi:hypothetical protein